MLSRRERRTSFANRLNSHLDNTVVAFVVSITFANVCVNFLKNAIGHRSHGDGLFILPIKSGYSVRTHPRIHRRSGHGGIGTHRRDHAHARNIKLFHVAHAWLTFDRVFVSTCDVSNKASSIAAAWRCR